MGAGSPWGSGFGSVSCFGSEGNASEFGSAYWFMQVMAWARGLDNGLFKVANTQLSREWDVHGAHVDACTVYLLRVLIMAAIPP